MGGCATKPKVLKDDDEKPVSPPPVPPPQKAEDKLMVQREGADVAVAPVDSPTRNLSLSNLFDKEESDGATGVFPGTENMNASDTTAFTANSQEAGTSKSMESLEKLPEPSADVSTEKIASQDSQIIPEDYTDTLEKLPAPAMPVVAADCLAEKVAVETDALTKNIKQIGEEKSAGEVLESTPTPDIVTDAPTEKIASQISVVVPEEYTDALEKIQAAPAVVRVADAPIEKLAVENTNDVENTKQIEEEKPAAAEEKDQKPEEKDIMAEEKKPVDTEDKKMLEENVVVVEKQIEVVESINATQESDSKEVKSDVPVEIK